MSNLKYPKKLLTFNETTRGSKPAANDQIRDNKGIDEVDKKV